MKRGPQVLAVVGGVFALLLISTNFLAIARDPGSWDDMRILTAIIQDWWSGDGTLYPSDIEVQRTPGVPSYRYPPLWAVSVLPLVLPFSQHTAIVLWAVLSSLVFLGGLLYLAFRLGLRPTDVTGALALLTVALLSPLYESFNGPTMELMMFGLLAASFVLLERRRVAWAALAFAGSVMFKVYPILFGFYFLLRREVRFLGWAAGWLVLLNLLPLPLIGLDETAEFYLELLPRQGGSVSYTENAGFEVLLMAVGWLGWLRSGLEPLDYTAFPRWAAGAWRVLLLLGFAALAIGLERRGGLATLRERYLLFGAWAAAFLLLIPVAWVNYQLYLIFPITGLLLWFRDTEWGRAHAVVALLAGAACLVLSVPANRLLAQRLHEPAPAPAFTLSSSVGEWLHPELVERVEHRSARLRALERAGELPRDDPAAARALLRSRGVPGPADVNPRHAELQQQYRWMSAVPGADERQRRALRQVRVQLRRTGLTTAQVIGLLVLRPLAGVWLLAAVVLACAVPTRPPRPESPGAARASPRRADAGAGAGEDDGGDGGDPGRQERSRSLSAPGTRGKPDGPRAGRYGPPREAPVRARASDSRSRAESATGPAGDSSRNRSRWRTSASESPSRLAK